MNPLGGTEIQYGLLYKYVDNDLLDNFQITTSVPEKIPLSKDKINILWQQNSYDQPNLIDWFSNKDNHKKYDFYVFNSHWCYEKFRMRFKIPCHKSTVIKNAEVLANTLNYNPVVMDYPYNMDPNSALFKLDKPQDDSLANTILNFDDVTTPSVADPVSLQPLKFDKKATNYDRYNAPGFKHLFNKIGFHPYVDNETVYNANSTWWDENARMRGQWG